MAEHDGKQVERLAFFSDAVFAIAITLLVIEIKLPHLASPYAEADLVNALLELVPQYIGFLISFFVIGRFWVGHHRVFGWLARGDDALVWRNLLFLLTIAFMPFPTALVSEYASTRVGVGVYAAWLLFAGLLNMLLIRHATKGPLLRHDVDGAAVRALRGPWVPIVIACIAIAAAMLQPALGLLALLTSPLISWLVTRRWRRA